MRIKMHFIWSIFGWISFLTSVSSYSQTLLNQFPFSAKSIQINHSTSDPEGNLLVGGYFYGNSANLNGFTVSALKPISSSVEHRVTAFVAKLKPNGTVLWALPVHSNRRFFGFTGSADPIHFSLFSINGSSFNGSDNYSHAVAQFLSVTSNGDVYVAGSTAADTLTVGSQELAINPSNRTYSNLPSQNMNVFISRITSSGTPVWTKVLKGESLRVKELVWQQDRIKCLIQGVVQQEIPSSGFSFQGQIGLRMISLNSSGAVQSENITVTHSPGTVLRTMIFPSSRLPSDTESYLPITYASEINSMATFQKYRSNGVLAGVENATNLSNLSYGAQGLARTPTNSYYVSHSFKAEGMSDTTTIFQNLVGSNLGGATIFLLNRISSDGCLEWSRAVQGELYNLVTDSDESVYALLWDTLSNQSQNIVEKYQTEYYGDTISGGVTIIFQPRPAAMKLLKYNRRGSKVLDVSLPMFKRPDNMIPWDFTFGNSWQMPTMPVSISRIKNDSITVAGGKFVCHFRDNSADSAFIINPLVCTPRALFRPLITRVSSREGTTQSDLQLSPNPAANVLRVQIGGEIGQKARLIICDLQGKTLWQKVFIGTLEAQQIDISQLQQGLYMIRLESNETVVSQRFVKH